MILYMKGIDNRFLVTFDIEHDQGELIQFAAVAFTKIGDSLFQTHSSLNIYVEKATLSPFITKFTNINAKDLRKAGLPLEEVKVVIDSFFEDIGEDVLLCSHGVKQDYQVLMENGIELNCARICTMERSKKMRGKHATVNLTAIMEELGLAPINAHNAYADAISTAFVLSYLLKQEENNE